MVRRIGAVAVLAAALVASTGVARADAPANVFSGVGLFADNPQDFPDPQTVAGWLQAAHFTWLAMHIDDVGTLDWTDPTWIPTMQAHGIQVGIWGVEGSNPIAGAAVANLALQLYGLDFYIADAETPYEGKRGSTGWQRSATFVRAFPAMQPTIPAALVTPAAATARASGSAVPPAASGRRRAKGAPPPCDGWAAPAAYPAPRLGARPRFGDDRPPGETGPAYSGRIAMQALGGPPANPARLLW